VNISAFLAATELFADLDTESLSALASVLEPASFAGGETLFEAGDRADCLYFVVHGRVRVSVQTDGVTRVLGEIGRGDVVGEMAPITGGVRTASVFALRDSELLRLSKSSFERVAMSHPRLLLMMSRRAIQRYERSLRSGRRRRSARPCTIAIVPISDSHETTALARGLASELRRHGHVLRVDSAAADSGLGEGKAQTPRDHPDREGVVSWLHDQEERHDFVLYEADRGPSQWTRRCLRQADRVLLVADADADPALSEIERETADERGGRDYDLVLLHRGRGRVHAGTSRWLSERRLGRHYHVHPASPPDTARLARLLIGTAVGLVFAGGGARCFAQIGVLRAMEALEIPVDVIGGTSMGAFLGSLYAMGWSTDEIQKFQRDLWKRIKPLSDYVVPYGSMISGRRYAKMARAVFGDHGIEDLATPFFCCTSNLTRARAEIHDTGPLWRRIGATMAVPGIAPPVFEEDGALLANLPVDAMRERCDGTIIAVDVTPERDLAVDATLTVSPSAWSLLYRRLNPFVEAHRVPTMLGVMARASALPGLQQMAQMKKQSDVFLDPPIEPFGLFDWLAIDDIVNVGYDYARPVLQNCDALAKVAGSSAAVRGDG